MEKMDSAKEDPEILAHRKTTEDDKATEGVGILLGDPKKAVVQTFYSDHSCHVRADHLQPE